MGKKWAYDAIGYKTILMEYEGCITSTRFFWALNSEDSLLPDFKVGLKPWFFASVFMEHVWKQAISILTSPEEQTVCLAI